VYEDVARVVGVAGNEVGGERREGDEAAVGADAASSLLLFASPPLLSTLTRVVTRTRPDGQTDHDQPTFGLRRHVRLGLVDDQYMAIFVPMLARV